MYVNPRPLPTLAEAHGWSLPPALTESTSTIAMPQVPSFQAFVKRTPPSTRDASPLPPLNFRDPATPAVALLPSSSSASSRRSSTSSIYSVDKGSWHRQDPQWKSADLADGQGLLLRPVAYSASTSKLTADLVPEFLEPKTYSPVAPSAWERLSSISTPDLPSPRAEPHPSILLPPRPAALQVPKKHLRTVSLEQAREDLQGSARLLPEEMRAQHLERSHSHDNPRLETWRESRPVISVPSVMVDQEGRGRLVAVVKVGQPYTTTSDAGQLPRATPGLTSNMFHVGSGPAKTMLSLAQTHEKSRQKVAQALGLGDKHEHQNRSQQPLRDTHYGRRVRRQSSASSSLEDDTMSDAQKIAKDYHAMLNDVRRDNSDESVKAHMKLVPQPLFHGKSATPAKSIAPNLSLGSQLSHYIQDDGTMSTGSGSADHFSTAHRPDSEPRLSSSGSIPISPPPPVNSDARLHLQSLLPRDGWTETKVSAGHQRHDTDIIRAGQGYTQGQSFPNTKGRRGPTARMLPPEVIAEQLKTPEGSPSDSPLDAYPLTPEDYIALLDEYQPSTPPRSVPLPPPPKDPYQPLLTARSTSQPRRPPPPAPINRPSEFPSSSSSYPPLPSPSSPHLYPLPSDKSRLSPSPFQATPIPTLHLGWSGKAKKSFDKARGTIPPRHNPRRSSEDTSKARGGSTSASFDSTSPPSSLPSTSPPPLKPGLLGGFTAKVGNSVGGIIHSAGHSISSVGSVVSGGKKEAGDGSGGGGGGVAAMWKDHKAAKRREDLKKLIRHVPNEVVNEDDRGRQGRMKLEDIAWEKANRGDWV